MGRGIRFAAGFFLGAFVGVAVLSRQPARFEFESRVLSPRAGSLAPVNALGNGVDDVAIGLDRTISLGRILEGRANATLPQNFAEPITVAGALDVDGDGLDEVLATSCDSITGARLFLIDPAAGVTDTLGPFRGEPYRSRPWTGAFQPVGAFEDADGHRTLVVLVVGTWRAPRELIAYDVTARRVRWARALGSFPANGVLVSASPGPSPLAVVSTSGTANGVHAGEWSDESSYVIAFDAAGGVRWAHRTGGANTMAQLERVPPDSAGSSDIVVSVHDHQGENPQPARLLWMDAMSGVIRREIALPTSFGPPRLLGAAPRRFVVGTADGEILLYDAALNRLARHHERESVEVWACEDLDADGRREVLASTAREGLVLDERLRVTGRFSFHGDTGAPVRLIPLRSGVGRCTIASLDESAMHWLPRRIPPLAHRPSLAWAAAGALAAGALAAWPRRLRPRRRRRDPGRLQEFLVDHMQIHHEVFDERGAVGALRSWVQQRHAGLEPGSDPREAARDGLLLVAIPALQRFLARAAALQADADSLARARRLLAAVEDRLAGASGARFEAEALMGTLNELQAACAALYREVGMRLDCRADVVVQDALRARQRQLADAGIASSFVCAPAAAIPLVFDPDELREIVGQLLENAARQLAGRPGAEVRVTAVLDVANPRWVIVEVADNGPGVAPELRERIFDVAYSTRRSGGFGLAHARECARAWRGSLELAGSAGAGARFRLRMRVLVPFEHAPGA